MDDELKIVFSTILFIFIISGLLLWMSISVDRKTCLASYVEYQPQYDIWAGCRVMWNGKLTPTDIVREIK